MNFFFLRKKSVFLSKHTSSVLYFGFREICCLKTSMNRSMTVLLNVTPSRIVIGRSIRSCNDLKSKALMRIMNSDTPTRVGFTRIFTNWIASADTSLKSCESLYSCERKREKKHLFKQTFYKYVINMPIVYLNCNERCVTLMSHVDRVM